MTTKKNNLKYVKKLKEEFSAFETLFSSQLEKIKKEHNKILIQKLSELVADIAKNEDLDEVYLREKYLNLKETSKKEEKKKKENKLENYNLLDHIEIDGNTYFYQNENDGDVFNEDSVKVGVFNNGKISFD